MLIEKAAQEAPNLSKYPTLQYPNLNYSQVLDKYPQGKALLFGYGSLINAQSESRTISAKAVHSMQPAIAFGLKRLFRSTGTMPRGLREMAASNGRNRRKTSMDRTTGSNMGLTVKWGLGMVDC